MYAKYAKLRDSKGMTDNSVATATGIPQSTMYDWKQRAAVQPKASLSLENMAKIANLLGVPIEYFLKEGD